MQSFQERWLHSVAENPGAPALVVHDSSNGLSRHWTRGELRDEAGRFAAWYAEQGITKGDVVIIILDHGAELAGAFLGAILLGAIPSFMPYSVDKQDPELYAQSHTRLFRKIRARAVVTSEPWLHRFSHVIEDCSMVQLRLDDLPAEASPCLEPVSTAPDDTIFLQHSSGTTSLKKGVALDNNCVLAQIDAYADRITLAEEDVVVSWLPLYHDMGLFACFLLPLATGCRIVLLNPFEWVYRPALLFDAITKYRGTLCWLPNFAFEHLCNTVTGADRFDLSGMKAFINCSEPCRPSTVEKFYRHFQDETGLKQGSIQTCYALAENSFSATQSEMGTSPRVLHADRKQLEKGVVREGNDQVESQPLLSNGRPIGNVKLKIEETTQSGNPDNTNVGEILLAGDSLFGGYFRDPERTCKVLQNGWYRTGDLGFLQGGELFVIGRVNDLIIVRGINYLAHEIENVAGSVDGIKAGRAVAIGVDDSELGTQKVVLAVETAQDDSEQLRTLTALTKSAVDNAMGLMLNHIEYVPPGWIVKSTSGKISRSENLRKYQKLQSRKDNE